MDTVFIISSFSWIFGISIASAIAVLFIFGVYNRTLCKTCKCKASLKGKTIIVTGASSGIGKEAARDFAERGGRIILACRNLTKAKNVADQIISSTGNSNVIVKLLDTSLMSSVRAFAKEVLEQESQLDVLVLNAGIGRSPGSGTRMTTSEGLEIAMATNHFGHFLLVHLLMGLLKKSKPSRVIFTSSRLKLVTKSDGDDINFEKSSYNNFKGYGLSKISLDVTARYFALLVYKQGVTFNYIYPGLVQTPIFSTSGGFYNSFFITTLLSLVTRTAKDGAQTLIHVAVSEKVEDVSGTLFMDCQEQRAFELACDVSFMKAIWKQSEDLVQLTPQERIL